LLGYFVGTMWQVRTSPSIKVLAECVIYLYQLLTVKMATPAHRFRLDCHYY